MAMRMLINHFFSRYESDDIYRTLILAYLSTFFNTLFDILHLILIIDDYLDKSLIISINLF